MSIYATLWCLRFPAQGDFHRGGEWIEILAQAVPGHIGTPVPGYGYEEGDPFASFLPPPVTDAPEEKHRAVVIVAAGASKGTERSPQEYAAPLLTLSGEEYERMPFHRLHDTICDLLRDERPRVIAQVFADGRWSVVRADGSIMQTGGDPQAAADADHAPSATAAEFPRTGIAAPAKQEGNMDQVPPPNSSDPVAIVRAVFDAYVRKDRAAIEGLIAEDFRFTSPLDNRLDRAAYLEICWPNSETAKGFDFIHLVPDGDRVFVTYEGESTEGGKSRNTEILTVRDGKLVEVEVHFGWSIPHEAKPGTHLDEE